MIKLTLDQVKGIYAYAKRDTIIKNYHYMNCKYVDAKNEIDRLNKIIDELEKGLIYTLEYIIDIDKITIKEYNAIYKKATNIDYDFHISFEENIRRLQELKEEGK